MRGFTLIELLVAISIIAIVATIGMTAYSNTTKSARNAKRIGDLQTIQAALEVYRSQNGKYPLSSSPNSYDCIEDTSKTAAPLLQPKFMDTIPTDPKTGCYKYLSDGKNYKLTLDPLVTAAGGDASSAISSQPAFIDPIDNSRWAIYTKGASAWSDDTNPGGGTSVAYTLGSGWNLIGIPIDIGPAIPAAVFKSANLSGRCSIIHGDENITDRDTGSISGEVSSISGGKAYYINCSSPTNLTLTGTPITAMPSLVTGWQFISLPHGYPAGFNPDNLAETYLDSITTRYCSEIYRWVNGGWTVHRNNLPTNNFALDAKEGYDLKCGTLLPICPSSGLVAYWKFDSSTQGNASVGGADFNLTSVGSVNYSSAGKIGEALGISTGGWTNYVTCMNSNCGGSGKLDPPSGISFAAWINTDNPSDIRYMFSKINAYSLNLTTTGKLYFQIYIAGNPTALFSNQAIPPSTWKFVVATFDGTTMKIYIDNALDNSATVPSPGSFSSTGNFTVGQLQSGSNGLIDEMGVWNRALSATEIDTMWNTGTGLTCP